MVGDNLRPGAWGQLDQLLIHGRGAGNFCLEEACIQPSHLLQALEHLQAAAAALALKRVRGIGDVLKFVKNEARDSERAVEEMSFANIGDAAVDQSAGVQKLQCLRARSGNFHRAWQGNMAQIAPFERANHHAEIAESEQRSKFEEGLGRFRLSGAGNHEGHEEGSEQTEDGTAGTSHKPADLRAAHAQLRQQNNHGDKEAEASGGQAGESEGTEAIAKNAGGANQSDASRPEIPVLAKETFGSGRLPGRVKKAGSILGRIRRCTGVAIEPRLAHETSSYSKIRFAPGK